jgi:hypothetical protein
VAAGGFETAVAGAWTYKGKDIYIHDAFFLFIQVIASKDTNTVHMLKSSVR